MDFSLSPELTELQQRTRQFIRQEIIPMESDTRQTPHGPSQALRDELIAKGRAAGLLTPHASKALGGLGLSHVAKSIVFEEAGYSPLGPVALNIHAPDEGNIHLLEAIANEAQRERWLKPLVAGRIRSCFAMTEPAPGAGSDPSMLQTSAVPDGNAYRITGKKWFITGEDGAAFTIVMARMLDGSTSMFLADMNQPGIELERQMDSLDSCFTGGHGVLSFENLRVPATDVLGEIGQGFRYAQVRLAPARLTHCMRWLGQARRAHDVAVRYATQRRSFGKSLVEHEGVGFMLADNEMDLYAARLAIWHTAWVLDQSLGDPRLGGHESSVTKVMVSEATWRIVDRAVQVLGGQGVTAETIVARIFCDLRAFRIYDGPSEVHRWSIAKRIAKRANDAP